MPTNDLPNLDDLAEAIAARLTRRLGVRGLPGQVGEAPSGEPDAELPPGWKRDQLEDGWQQLFSEASVGIESIEFTQSIQFNSAVTPGYGTPNSVPLVAYKTLVARAYPSIRRGRLGGDNLTGQKVTGEITLSVGNRIIHRGSPTRSDGVSVGRLSDIDRTLWDRQLNGLSGGGLDGPDLVPVFVNPTLNFLVPAYWYRPADSPSPLSIDLLDANRRVLATHHCRFIAARACNCSCDNCGHGVRHAASAGGEPVPIEREPWLDFCEVIEWPVGKVTAIAFHDGGESIQVVEVGEAPTVSITGPEEDGERLRVRVEAHHPRSSTSVIVLFRADQDETWQVVATDPPDGVVSVERGRLPGGNACRFRALAGAELMTATADTKPFALAPTPRTAFLALPTGAESGCCPLPLGPVPLRVLFDNHGHGSVEPRDITWMSSLDGDLGWGHAVVPDLSEGHHSISVTAPDGLGGRVEQRGIIVVGGAEQRGIIVVGG